MDWILATGDRLFQCGISIVPAGGGIALNSGPYDGFLFYVII